MTNYNVNTSVTTTQVKKLNTDNKTEGLCHFCTTAFFSIPPEVTTVFRLLWSSVL